MTDTSTFWNAVNGYGDWILVGTNLANGTDLETAMLISIFTDQLAGSSDVIPDGTGDPRGWIGDLDETVLIGSRLWLHLERAKLTQDAANQARSDVAAALQWMIDDGVVASFQISTDLVEPNQLRLEVDAYQKDGTKLASVSADLWNQVT